jgi:hypothetical protein
MVPALPVLVLIVAVLTRCAAQSTYKRDVLEMRRKRTPSVVILVSMDASTPWRDRLNHLIMRCVDVAFIKLLLTYKAEDQVPDEGVFDSMYDRFVHIEMGITKPLHPSKYMQRLVRRFVNGSEPLVIVVTEGCLLHDNFSQHLQQFLTVFHGDAIVSCPPSHSSGKAQFPTLRVRSNGTIARDNSKPFHDDSLRQGMELVPSVSWCPEMTLSTGAHLKRWVQTPSVSFVDQTHSIPELAHLVPSRALLAPNEKMEDHVLDHDEGSASHTLARSEHIGLTGKSSSRERIVKYGTVFRARVALESLRDQS